MTTLHNCGLVRFSKKTGKIDTTMTAIGNGLLQLWALQNTTKSKATVIVDIDERKTLSEYIGTADGFPDIRKSEEEFEFNFPEELFDIMDEEVTKRNAERS